jgi:tetratricopeptide (TPR) repeat protein
MKKHLVFSALLIISVCFFSSSQAFAYSSADYYKAGLQLYSAKNYSQAVRYFGAAIQLDPNNIAALQARGNCNYVSGDYNDALSDYQRVQAIAPSDALTQFISKIQSKINSTSAAPASAPSTPNTYYTQGVSYFQQKQYAQAIPYFQQATHQDPGNYKPYYYLGFSQMMLRDYRDAAVALGICNLRNPNPSIESYDNRLKATLSSDDAQWVNDQIAMAANQTSYANSPQYADPNTFGIRLEPTLQTFSIPGLNTYEQSEQAEAENNNTSFTASVPTGGLEITLEPTYRITSNIEVGLPISYDSIGTYSDSEGVTMNFTDISIGLDGRYFIITGEIQPFIGAGVAFHMVSASTPNSSSSTTTGSSNSASTSGIGEQVQLGIDWHLDKMFALSLYGGYQLANMGSTWSANGQTGNLFGSLTGDTSSSDDAFDLSGPFAGLQISAFFH